MAPPRPLTEPMRGQLREFGPALHDLYVRFQPLLAELVALYGIEPREGAAKILGAVSKDEEFWIAELAEGLAPEELSVWKLPAASFTVKNTSVPADVRTEMKAFRKTVDAKLNRWFEKLMGFLKDYLKDTLPPLTPAEKHQARQAKMAKIALGLAEMQESARKEAEAAAAADEHTALEGAERAYKEAYEGADIKEKAKMRAERARLQAREDLSEADKILCAAGKKKAARKPYTRKALKKEKQLAEVSTSDEGRYKAIQLVHNAMELLDNGGKPEDIRELLEDVLDALDAPNQDAYDDEDSGEHACGGASAPEEEESSDEEA